MSFGASLMAGHTNRLRRRIPRELPRSLRPTPSLLRSRKMFRAVGVCMALVSIGACVLLITSQEGRVAPSASIRRLHMQRAVAALFTGIPQHGVILGQPTAPVTLQVFLDLEDWDSTRWLDFMLPPILEKFVRTNVVRLEFRSFKTDTLNGAPFYAQQVAALAAGSQNLLWNYVTTFMNEQGREFTNYVTEEFIASIAEQVPGLNFAEWEQARTVRMVKIVLADIRTARKAGLHVTPSFRVGLTGGKMSKFIGRHFTIYHKFIVRKRSSGERYVAGISPLAQHPVSLIDAVDLKKAVKKLI
jgi:protein-disulfide isomerase